MNDNIIEFRKGEQYIRAKDIQKMFGIARSTVDNWVKYGYFVRYKVGRNIFYKTSDVMALVNGGVEALG